MGLRETKKAATRAAMSEAAAQIALRQGAEKLTVAAVAEAAGVSTRTFHNYFTSREEPLVEALATRVRTLVERLSEIPTEVCMADAAEQLLIEAVRMDQTDGPEGIAAIFRLSDFLETTSGADLKATVHAELMPIIDEFRTRHPQLSRFEAGVGLDLLATTAANALEAYYESAAPRDPERGVELLHQAFHVLRAIK
ncbi:hypothetical protein CFRA_03795 [Corynebacterium frankenforstense DSM 45800]|uniref:HTH tetR-type domain-containing protein n=2 Tax=Corynebacterium TaxID=1716 RepID=A0A1L7CRR6_9CORY|nr:hypothetical protein CFRA_03795 [Corynebacterium frankenforstense DSM 45800]